MNGIGATGSWSLRPQSSLTGATKADIVVAGAEIPRKVPSALRGGELRRRRVVPPASRPAHRAGLEIFASVRIVVRIREIGAAHPFPGISSKIKETVRAGSFRKTIYRSRLVVGRMESGFCFVGRAVSPRILAAIRAARGLPPFRFRRPPLSTPPPVIARTEPGGFNHRVILKADIGNPLVSPFVDARVIVIKIEKPLLL